MKLSFSGLAPVRHQWPIFLVFVALFASLSVFVPYFLSLENLVGLALSVSMVGMVACSMMLCLASGDFDLSVEGVAVLAGVVCAVVLSTTKNVFLAIVLALGAGTVIGFLNGSIVARIGINALITTLVMSSIVRGLSFIVSGGSAVSISDESFLVLGNGSLLGVPYPIWITAAMFAIFGLLLNHTAFGREVLAVGGNKEAAKRAGVRVATIRVWIFTLQGLIAAGAGIVAASRMTSGQPNSSSGFALDVIVACLLGGVSHTNGTGTMRGVIIGVLLMGTLQNAMNLLGLPPFYQYVAKGGILLTALVLDKLNNDRKKRLGGLRSPAKKARA